MPDKNLSYGDSLKHEWENAAAEICPVCEQHTIIRRIYEKNTYEVKGEEITVRHTVSMCPRCGEKWTNTKDEDDGLEKAFTIYMKRKNPEARKFKTFTFRADAAYVAICPTCAREYSLRNRACGKTEQLEICNAKGCNNRAVYLVMLGKI